MHLYLLDRFVLTGLYAAGNSPGQFVTEIRDDIARWGKVARAANVRAD